MLHSSPTHRAMSLHIRIFGQTRKAVPVFVVKMEDRNKSVGSFDSRFNKLISEEEDLSTDDQTLYSNQEKQQVSMSMVGPESSLWHYKLLAVSLAVLVVILLAVDIGLMVYYFRLNDGLHLVTDIDSELGKMHASYKTLIQRRTEMMTELKRIMSEQNLINWEMEHQERRDERYKDKAERIQGEIALLESQLPMIKEGCKRCLPGWIFMNSMCYFFPFSTNFMIRSWYDARVFCKDRGGDLAVLDTRDKSLAVSRVINNHRHTYWIGLSDSEEEGVWKWVNGRPLTDGFWIPGEPNDVGNEDCACMLIKDNPFLIWNDMQCNTIAKWICEMAPRFTI